MTQTNLLERVWAAKVPDRELDRAINDAVGLDNGYHCDAGYTSSIDSALTLIPEGWQPVRLGFPQSVNRKYWFVIYPPTNHPYWKYGIVAEPGETAALAVCAAALRAREIVEAT